MPKAIAFETTTVSVEKTMMEIEKLLADAGATQTMRENDKRHRPCGMSFQIETPDGLVPFRLPVNIDAVYQLLLAERRNNWEQWVQERVDAQAQRTAWRIIREWVHVQTTLIQTQMVTVTEVFMPYMLSDGNQTLYERLMEHGMKALTEPVEAAS